MSDAQETPIQRKVTVLGGGSFGTALANIAAENGHHVVQWMRNADQASEMAATRENKHYLPGCVLNERITPVTDFATALADSELVLVAIPSKFFRDVLRQAKPFIRPDQSLVSTTKGIEAGSFKLMSEVIKEELPDNKVGVISGPNLAKELGKKQLTATVIASDSPDVCTQVQAIFHGKYFRVYAGSDTYGAELGGALKNIYAIAAGMSAALQMGENTRSMLMTRSLAEMSRFAVRMGADPMTFLGLAGVGDLIVTCTSPLSRNYRVGFALGQGKDLDTIVAELGEVAEGVDTIRHVKLKSDDLEIYMPLVQALYSVVFEQCPVKLAIGQLMMSEHKEDVEFEVLDKNLS